MGFIDYLSNGIDTNKIRLGGSEKNIQNSIINYFVNLGYINYTTFYVQEKFRLKNLNSAKPDVVLKMNEKVYLLEVKLQPDEERGAIRFQRAIVDLLYLGNEVLKKDCLEAYLLFVDYTKSRYIERNYLLEALIPLVKFNLPDKLIWATAPKTDVEYTIIAVSK